MKLGGCMMKITKTPPHRTKVWVSKVCLQFAIYLLLLVNIPLSSQAQVTEPAVECPTALIHNAIRGEYGITSTLLEYSNIDINASLSHCGLTYSVHVSGTANEFEQVAYPEGSTLLHIVAHRTQNTVIYRLLKFHGADEFLADANGQTPFQIMKSHGFLSMSID